MALRKLGSWFRKMRLVYRKLLNILDTRNKKDIKIVIFSASATILIDCNTFIFMCTH